MWVEQRAHNTYLIRELLRANMGQEDDALKPGQRLSLSGPVSPDLNTSSGQHLVRVSKGEGQGYNVLPIDVAKVTGNPELGKFLSGIVRRQNATNAALQCLTRVPVSACDRPLFGAETVSLRASAMSVFGNLPSSVIGLLMCCSGSSCCRSSLLAHVHSRTGCQHVQMFV